MFRVNLGVIIEAYLNGIIYMSDAYYHNNRMSYPDSTDKPARLDDNTLFIISNTTPHPLWNFRSIGVINFKLHSITTSTLDVY